MRFKAIIFAAVISVFAAGTALATVPYEFNPEADCYGWKIAGIMSFGTSNCADIDYWVKLVQGYDTLMTFTGSDQICSDNPDFLYEDVWGMELCGDYKVLGWFKFVGSDGWGIRTFETEFTCECDDEEYGCTYTPGYWKNHEDAWPVDMLTIGGNDYTKADLMDIFDMPTRLGDITIKLMHHLIAAKLNVLSGADDSIQGVIDDADAFLMIHPFLSNPMGDARYEAEELKDLLCEYNEIPCDEEEEEEDDEMGPMTVKEIINTRAATEESSWGAIKKKMK